MKDLQKNHPLEKRKHFAFEGLGIIINLGHLFGALETIAKVGAAYIEALDPLILHELCAKKDMSTATKISDEIYDSTLYKRYWVPTPE